MTLSREEIAVRVLCALAGRDGYGTDTATADAVIYADTLLRNLALTHTPAPVAPPAGKYEPRVGDVVRWGTIPHAYVVTRVSPELGGMYCEDRTWREWFGGEAPHYCEFVRKATPSELAAAGLAVPPPAPTPAPEAKRPTHIRWTVSAFPDEVCRVLRWVDGKPVVGRYNTRTGIDESKESDPIEPGGWAPAPCPPPVAGRGEKDEAVRGLVAFAARVSNTLHPNKTKHNTNPTTKTKQPITPTHKTKLYKKRNK